MFKPFLAGMAILAALGPASAFAQPSAKPLRLGWCTPSKGISLAPLAVAKKYGWLAQEGIDLEIVNIASGNDCAKFVATGEVSVAAPSIEATAAMAARGAPLRTFFTIQQVSSWGVEAPAEHAIKTVADLKGKKVGVISLSALGATVIKGLARSAGLDPDKDLKLIAVGDAQRAAHFLKRGEIDAVSIFTLAHLQIAALGVDLEPISTPALDNVPSIGLVATADYLKNNQKQAVGLARAYAKGLAFTFSSPQAAEKAFYEVFPEAAPASNIAEGMHQSNIALTTFHASAPSPLHGNLPAWGYSRPEVYDGYLSNLHEWGLLPKKLAANQVIDNSLIKQINDFDAAAIVQQARAAAADAK